MPAAKRGIVTLISGLAAASAALWILAPPEGGSPAGVAVLLVALGVVVVEWWPLGVEHRGEMMHVTLSGILIVIGCIVIGPGPTLVVRVVGSAFVLAVRWHLPPQKLLFNAVAHTIEVWTVGTVIGTALSRGATDITLWPAILVGLFAAEVVSFAVVVAAMWTAAGRLRTDALHQMGVATCYSVAISAAFATVGVILIGVHPAATLGLAVIFALLVQTNRARHGLSERYHNLTSLYSFMDILTSTETADVIPILLQEAERVTGAERTTLLLSAGPDSASFRLRPEGGLVEHEVDPAAVAALAASVHSGTLIASGAGRPVPALTGGPGDQALIVSFGQDTVLGVLLLEGRRGNMPDFDHTDLQLARGMARHAGTALVTVRLVEQLQDSSRTMQRLALFDRDTGLHNRTGLLRKGLDTRDRAIALVEIGDLDTIEGTFGHHSAGQVVSAIASRLTAMDALGIISVARVADNRFAVVLDGADDAVGIHQRVRHLRSEVQAPIRETGVNIEVQVLVGVATASATDGSVERMLRAAAGALSQAKQHGAGDTVWFDPSMDAQATARIRLASDLRDAIDAGELTLAYQPKVDLASGRIVGVEALCRWIRQDGHAVDPGEFISIAEQTGLIRPLTECVMAEAIAQAGRWRAAGLNLTMAINVSPDAVRDPLVVRSLIDHCIAAEVPPSMITVEITESLMMGDLERGSGLLWVLDEAGVRISVDDFGTGYSSLAQLKDLPVDELKIDRSFVIDIERSTADQAITAAIVAMAHQLDLDVVAEGVETPAALAILRDTGCQVAQGYLLGRPMSARDLTARAAEGAEEGAATSDRVLPFRRTQPGR